jgi:hypothetical protein
VEEGEERDGVFVYQSLSGRLDGRGSKSFGGELTFVPGSLARPSGPAFHVAVARFTMTLSEFLF